MGKHRLRKSQAALTQDFPPVSALSDTYCTLYTFLYISTQREELT